MWLESLTVKTPRKEECAKNDLNTLRNDDLIGRLHGLGDVRSDIVSEGFGCTATEKVEIVKMILVLCVVRERRVSTHRQCGGACYITVVTSLPLWLALQTLRSVTVVSETSGSVRVPPVCLNPCSDVVFSQACD
jgi:hypothetical protein